ncbi:HpcH/HpaI aldolase/citrate lyase family protein [Pelomonas sp. KK5]|uniref:HpcH/HpaI aldolase family protein n=1 Tax=Pelomonas sp. KK5 TaxID=1855730 RepID=UPI00097BE312|nr:aldolase/citrate lyase family protein [Pelomonas sp. KK5]
MTNPFQQLLAKENPVGTWIMSASPLVAEAIGCAGYDWGVIDMEHTPIDLMTLVHMLQAVAGTKMTPVVRVPWNDSVAIKRAMDAGAQTLLLPFVQDAAEAGAAASACRYPPEGTRGMAGMSRASRFGTAPNYLTTANEGVSVIVQLETTASIEQADAIAATAGVDALFVGPGDLSATMGHVGQLTHPAVLEQTRRAIAAAKAHGKPIGTVGGTPEVCALYREMGFDFVAIASDLGLLMRSAQAALAAVRNETITAAKPQGAY